MRTHPVGEGLDERGPGALARPGQGGTGDGEDGEDVVAVDRTPGNPKPAARRNSGTLDCRSIGTEMAYWLFWQKKTTGASKVAAQIIASLTSPWLVAPSPRKAIAAASAVSRWMPIA